MAVQVRKERYASAIQCGERLTQIRKAQKLTRKEVAEKTGFSAQQIFLVEKGEINTPIETLDRIAHALGVSLAELFQGEDKESAAQPRDEEFRTLYSAVSSHYSEVVSLLTDHLTQKYA